MTKSDNGSMRCPCLSGETYENCCGPLLAGGAAPTAERLMRSRFTAFARGEAAHLLRTWHPSTRPRSLELDEDILWRRLEILGTEHGGPFETSGVVLFEAFYRDADGNGSLRERSRFVRESGNWLYLDGAPG